MAKIKKKRGNDIQILSLEIDIAKLENIINRLKLQAIQNNLNSIKTELDIITTFLFQHLYLFFISHNMHTIIEHCVPIFLIKHSF